MFSIDQAIERLRSLYPVPLNAEEMGYYLELHEVDFAGVLLIHNWTAVMNAMTNDSKKIEYFSLMWARMNGSDEFDEDHLINKISKALCFTAFEPGAGRYLSGSVTECNAQIVQTAQYEMSLEGQIKDPWWSKLLKREKEVVDDVYRTIRVILKNNRYLTLWYLIKIGQIGIIPQEPKNGETS
jgi:hypothetical protein